MWQRKLSQEHYKYILSVLFSTYELLPLLQFWVCGTSRWADLLRRCRGLRSRCERSRGTPDPAPATRWLLPLRKILCKDRSTACSSCDLHPSITGAAVPMLKFLVRSCLWAYAFRVRGLGWVDCTSSTNQINWGPRGDYYDAFFIKEPNKNEPAHKNNAAIIITTRNVILVVRRLLILSVVLQHIYISPGFHNKHSLSEMPSVHHFSCQTLMHSTQACLLAQWHDLEHRERDRGRETLFLSAPSTHLCSRETLCLSDQFFGVHILCSGCLLKL